MVGGCAVGESGRTAGFGGKGSCSTEMQFGDRGVDSLCRGYHSESSFSDGDGEGGSTGGGIRRYRRQTNKYGEHSRKVSGEGDVSGPARINVSCQSVSEVVSGKRVPASHDASSGL